MSFWTKEKREVKDVRFQVTVDNLQVIVEEWNTHGRYIFAGQLRKQRTSGWGV